MSEDVINKEPLPTGFKMWKFKSCIADGESLKTLDGKQLNFAGVRPSKRAFTFHACSAIRTAENQG